MVKIGVLRTRQVYRATRLSTGLLLLVCLAPVRSHGQAIAETGMATSASAGMAASVATKALSTPPSGSALPGASTDAPPAPQPMGVREGPAVEEANRKAFEQSAGKDAAKLLLRSEPTQALAYLDGKSVGLTPLLLIVPPGKYRVEMRGQHQESGAVDLDLAPKETRQYLLPLAPHFAGSVTVRPSPSASVTVNFNKPSNATVPSFGASRAAAPAAAQPAAPVPSGPPPGGSGREMFESQAGNDAAKITLKSDPADAQVYIDGVYVGNAPVEIRLAPGRYQVIMRGKEGDSGEQFVGLLPQETKQVTLPLSALYPAKVSVQWQQAGSGSH